MSVFSDPESTVRDALTAGYAVAGTAPLSIETEFPAGSVPKSSYRVQLDFEGDNADDYPAAARAIVRVVVWGNKLDRTLVKYEANRARDLLGSTVVAGVAGFVPQGRSAVSQDPDTS